jgi:serine/threonine protein kinase
MNEPPDNVESIFFAALTKAGPAERAAYLDEACRDAPQLRRSVERLLEAHIKAGGFLEGPPAELLPTVDRPDDGQPAGGAARAADDLVGTHVGPYKLLEQIGEGGMGVVYMADQQVPIRRRVALKVIKPGLDTRQVIARFEAERQALALMDHPNIARVLDAGTADSGRSYFVMELVRGVPITEYCDQNNLPLHERLELFAHVCHAVQHAHQKGIIHRDIKPSNVLVTMNDGRAVPKVIDFGVAKATNQQLTEKTLFTNFAQMVGTPLYMSPEQAEMTSLDVDTRTDIYSLGVLLYELLTGTTPFDRKSLRDAAYDEIRRIIREQVPPRPSQRISTLGQQRTVVAAHRQADPNRLSQLVQGDLDWIVMKALDKDRTRRYETATGLAADLRRYLLDQPVEAGPPSSLYRFRKFARRNRTAITTAGVLMSALILATAVSSWQAIRATRAERRAELARVAESEQRVKEHDAKLLAEVERTKAEEQRALANQKTAEALASADREKQAQQEAARERDKALALTRRALVQSVDELIAKAEYLWKSGPQGKTEALTVIRSAAQLRREASPVSSASPVPQDKEVDEYETRWHNQAPRLDRIAAKWLLCAGLVQKGSFTFEARKFGGIEGITVSPRGTRIAMWRSIRGANKTDILVLDQTGKTLARVPEGPLNAPLTIAFSDESHLRVGNGYAWEFTLPDEPVAATLKNPKRLPWHTPDAISHPMEEFENVLVWSANDRFVATADDSRLFLRAKVAANLPQQLIWSLPSSGGFLSCDFAGERLFFTANHSDPLGSPDLVGFFDTHTSLCRTASLPAASETASYRGVGILSYDGGLYIYDGDGGFLGNSNEIRFLDFALVLPEISALQLNTGTAIKAVEAEQTDGVCVGLVDGAVARQDTHGREKWRTPVGTTREWEARTESTLANEFYSVCGYADEQDLVFVCRSTALDQAARTQECLRFYHTADGTESTLSMPSDAEFVRAVADNRFLVYRRGIGASNKTLIVDVLSRSIVKEMDGVPELASKSNKARRILPIRAGDNLQFWRLTDFSLVGEVPVTCIKDDSDKNPLLALCIDGDETYAVVPQGAPSGSAKSAPNDGVVIVCLSPFATTRFEREPHLRMSYYQVTSFLEQAVLVKSGKDTLVLRIGDADWSGRQHVTCFDLANVKTSAAEFGSVIVCESEPRILGSRVIDKQWEMFDAHDMTSLCVFKQTQGSPSHFDKSSSRFVVTDVNGNLTSHRWSDGEEASLGEAGSKLLYDGGRFQLRKSSAGATCLVTEGNSIVPLEIARDAKDVDGASILSANGATLLRENGLWDARTGKQIARWETTDRLAYDDRAQQVLTRAADGDTFHLKVYDLTTGGLISDVPCEGLPRDMQDCHFEWGPRAHSFVVRVPRGLTLIDSATGKTVKSISNGTHLGPPKRILSCDRLSSVISSSDGVILKWRQQDGAFEEELFRTEATILDFDVSENGQLMVILTDKDLVLKEVRGGAESRQVTSVPADKIVAVRFLGSGDVLVACRDGIAKRISATDGALVAECKVSPAAITAVAMSPSRNVAYLLTGDGDLHRLDLQSFAVTNTVRASGGTAALCAADDTTCFTAGNQIDAWLMTDAKRLWSIETQDGPITALGYQRADDRLVTVDRDGQSYLVSLRDMSDAFVGLGLIPLQGFARSPEETAARAEIDRLYEELVLVDDVIAAVNRRADFNASIRQAAVAHARSKAREPEDLYATAWTQMRAPQQDPLKLADAQRIARAFVRHEPGNLKYTRLLAMACCKTGECAEAIALLNAAKANDRGNLAIQMLANLNMGNRDEAKRIVQAIGVAPPLSGLTESEVRDLQLGLEASLAKLIDRAEEAYKQKDWPTAEESFSLAFPLGTDVLQFLQDWSVALAMQGRWSDSAQINRRAVIASKGMFNCLYNQVILQHAAGDDEGYRATAVELFSRYEKTIYPDVAFSVAMALVLSDKPAVDVSQVLALAKRVADTDVRDPAYKVVVGAAQFRCGQLDEAIDTISKALPQHAVAELAAPKMLDQIRVSRMLGETMLARAYHARGDHEALAKQLETLQALIKKLASGPPQNSPGMVPWAIPVAVELSQREVVKLSAPVIESKQP